MIMKTAISIISLLLFGLCCFISQYCYINTTASLPLGIYLKTEEAITPGVLVVFSPPKNLAEFVAKYTPKETPLLKKVVAVEEESYYLPKAATEDSKGRAVVPYFPRVGRVPHDHIIVQGETIYSLDSRYLGPIPLEQIITTVKPLFTWSDHAKASSR